MNEKLRDLVGQANKRIDDKEAEREKQFRQRDEAEAERGFQEFKQKVESALGREVLDAIGPVTFHNSLPQSNSMTFVQDSRTFRFQQEADFLCELKEEATGKWLGHQFNLRNADSKDAFLSALGEALKAPAKERGPGKSRPDRG